MSDPWPHSTRDDCPDCVAKLPVEQQRGRIKDLCRRWTCETLDYDENEALGLWIHYFSRALCGCDQRRIARLYIECGILPVLCKSAQSQEETIPHTCFNILFRLIDQNLLNQGELLELLGPLRVLRLCEESITVPGSLTRTAAARLARQLFHLPITSEKCSENFRPEFVVALLEQIQRENIPFLKAELIDGYYGWELEGFYRRLPAKYYEACLPRYMCMQHETYALTWTSIFMAKEKDSTWLMDVVNRFPHFISGLVTCASFLPFPALPNCSQQSIALYVLDVLLYMTITPTPILQSTDTNALCTNNVFSKCPDIVDRLVTFLDQLVGLIRSGLKSHIDTLFSKLDQFHPHIPPTTDDIESAIMEVKREFNTLMVCLCKLSAVADILPAFIAHKAVFEDVVQLYVENQVVCSCMVSAALIIIGRLCSFANCTTVIPKDVAKHLHYKARSSPKKRNRDGIMALVLVEKLWFPEITPFGIEQLALKSLKECGWCGKPNQSLRCTRCLTTYYCNKACQKKDWPHHKASCRAPATTITTPPPSTPSTPNPNAQPQPATPNKNS